MDRYYLNLWGCGVVLMVGILIGAGNYRAAVVLTAALVAFTGIGHWLGRRTRESNPVGREPEPR